MTVKGNNLLFRFEEKPKLPLKYIKWSVFSLMQNSEKRLLRKISVNSFFYSTYIKSAQQLGIKFKYGQNTAVVRSISHRAAGALYFNWIISIATFSQCIQYVSCFFPNFYSAHNGFFFLFPQFHLVSNSHRCSFSLEGHCCTKLNMNYLDLKPVFYFRHCVFLCNNPVCPKSMRFIEFSAILDRSKLGIAIKGHYLIEKGMLQWQPLAIVSFVLPTYLFFYECGSRTVSVTRDTRNEERTTKKNTCKLLHSQSWSGGSGSSQLWWCRGISPRSCKITNNEWNYHACFLLWKTHFLRTKLTLSEGWLGGKRYALFFRWMHMEILARSSSSIMCFEFEAECDRILSTLWIPIGLPRISSFAWSRLLHDFTWICVDNKFIEK